MKPAELDLLMQSVLDGEASEAETIALGTHLAADPDAHKRFEAVRWIFNELSKVPQEQPPAGFAEGVMAKVPAREARPGLPFQLFWKSLVLGMRSHPPGATPGQPATDPRSFAMGPFPGEHDMNQQDKKSRRNLWIGGGLAAAAAVIGLAQFTDFPASGESTAGTIVPAQRFRAPQPTAGDVKLGAPTTGGTQQPVGVAGVSNQAASNQAAANQAASSQAASNQAASNQAAANQAAANQAAMNQAAANQAASNQAAANQAASNQATSNQAAANQAAMNQAAANQAAANQAAANQAAMNQARANQATTNQAAANQAAANRAAANQAAMNQAAANQAAANQAAANQAAANQAAANRATANQAAANQAAGRVANEAMKK